MRGMAKEDGGEQESVVSGKPNEQSEGDGENKILGGRGGEKFDFVPVTCLLRHTLAC